MSSSEPVRYVDLVEGDALVDDERTYVVVSVTDDRVIWLYTHDGYYVDTNRTKEIVHINGGRRLILRKDVSSRR